MTPANDNTPSFDITAGVDGYRVWVLKPSGLPGSVVAECRTATAAARLWGELTGKAKLENFG